MKSFATLLAIGSCVSSVSGIQFLERREEPKTIASDLFRERRGLSEQIEKRGTDVLQIDGTESGIQYYMNITVGSPPQPITVQVDTGSSNIILNAPKITGAIGGTYDVNISSSYGYLNNDMRVSYSEQSVAGDWVLDTVVIGNITLNETILGVTYNHTQGYLPQSILGIGPKDNPNSNDSPFLPYFMADQGLISSPSYSLWLNDIDAPSGSLLFGGIDRSKFSGNLSSTPMVRDGPNGTYLHSQIPFTGLFIDNGMGATTNIQNTSSESFPLDVALDSGSPAIYLPEFATKDIYTQFNVTSNKTSGQATCDCGLVSNTARIGFTFNSNTSISVPLRDLVIPAPAHNPYAPPLPSGRCYFGTWNPVFTNLKNPNGALILGDPFLRNAYAVFDFGSYEISLAPAVLNTTAAPDIVEIAPPAPSGTGNVMPAGTPSPTSSPPPKSVAPRAVQSSSGFLSAMVAAILVALFF